ncbi:uncharacterized protein LOC134835115 [Culicoides brevitarsis]|uniref:uncharacterized protein LOC134835115 n=1 Tax=Culicoides brevitarsis TaxID=469753 RepID=UPI00307B10E4
MQTKLVFISLLLVIGVPLIFAQRGSYAGSRSQGYKDRYRQPEMRVSDSTDPIPVNAHGDRGLVDRIALMPRENQPFWYINAKALEAQRQSPFPILNGDNLQSLDTGASTMQFGSHASGRSPFAG